MARGPRYALKFRRRREGKTNYGRRLKLLRAKIPRLVVRKSNKYISVQLIDYAQKGDRTLLAAHSSELKALGWKYGLKSTPAAYLIGLLAAKKARENKIHQAILDMGLYEPTKGAKIFAVLKGAVENGLKISHSPEIIPDGKRVSGQHIAEWLKKPELSRDFEQVKQKLMVK